MSWVLSNVHSRAVLRRRAEGQVLTSSTVSKTELSRGKPITLGIAGPVYGLGYSAEDDLRVDFESRSRNFYLSRRCHRLDADNRNVLTIVSYRRPPAVHGDRCVPRDHIGPTLVRLARLGSELSVWTDAPTYWGENSLR